MLDHVHLGVAHRRAAVGVALAPRLCPADLGVRCFADCGIHEPRHLLDLRLREQSLAMRGVGEQGLRVAECRRPRLRTRDRSAGEQDVRVHVGVQERIRSSQEHRIEELVLYVAGRGRDVQPVAPIGRERPGVIESALGCPTTRAGCCGVQLRQVEHVHPWLRSIGRRQQVRLPVQVDHAQRVHRLVEVRGGQAGGLLDLLARHLLDLALGQRRASLVLAHPGVHDHRLISGEAEVSRHAGALGDVLVLVGGLPAVEVERLTPGNRDLATLLQVLQLARGVVVPARDVGCDAHLAQQLPHGLRGLGRCSLHHSLLLAEVSLDRRAHSSSSTDDLLRLDTSALRGGARSRGGVCLHAGWCDHQLGELKPADPVELWVLIDVLHREVGVQMVTKAATVRGDLPVREALVQHLEQVLTQRVARRGRLEVLREQRRHLPDLRVEGTRRAVGQAGRREDVSNPCILPQQVRQCRVQNARLRRGRLLQLVQQSLRVKADAAHGFERAGE